MHPFQDTGVYIACHITEIRRDIPFYQRAVYLAALVIHLVHCPYPACNGYLFAHRRRFDDCSQLFGTGTHRVFDIFLEHCVKLIIVDNPLSSNPDNQPAVFRAVDMINSDKVPEQGTEVILTDAAEYRQGQYSGGKLRRCHLT